MAPQLKHILMALPHPCIPQAADYVNVTGKTILVLGTQNPWVEAVLLSKKPAKIVTLEYGYFIRCG